jgi:hypothetical protein
VSCIYITIWTHKPCTTPRNPPLYDRSLHATHPAPQIISRPVTSVTTVALPSNCTSKFTNPILTDCCTIRTVCVCLNECDVSPWSLWGFGVQEITFSITAIYFTDRAKCRSVLRFTQVQNSMVIWVVTPSVAVWYSGAPLLHLTVWQFCIADSPWSKPKSVDLLPRCYDVLTVFAEDVRRLSILCLWFSVAFRYYKRVAVFCFDSWYKFYTMRNFVAFWD